MNSNYNKNLTKKTKPLKKQIFSFFISFVIVLLTAYFTPGNRFLYLGIVLLSTLVLVVMKFFLRKVIKQSLPITIAVMAIFVVLWTIEMMREHLSFAFAWIFLSVPVTLLYWLLQMFIEKYIGKIFTFTPRN